MVHLLPSFIHGRHRKMGVFFMTLFIPSFIHGRPGWAQHGKSRSGRDWFGGAGKAW